MPGKIAMAKWIGLASVSIIFALHLVNAQTEPVKQPSWNWQAGEQLHYQVKWSEQSQWGGTSFTWDLKEDWLIDVKIHQVNDDGTAILNVTFPKIKASFTGEKFRLAYGGGDDDYKGAGSKELPQNARLGSIPRFIEGITVTLITGDLNQITGLPEEEHKDKYSIVPTEKEFGSYSWGHYDYGRMFLSRLFLNLPDKPIDRKEPWCIDKDLFLQCITYFGENRIGKLMENIRITERKEVLKDGVKCIYLKFTSEITQSGISQKKGKGSGEIYFDVQNRRLINLKSNIQFSLSSYVVPKVGFHEPEVVGSARVEINQIKPGKK